MLQHIPPHEISLAKILLQVLSVGVKPWKGISWRRFIVISTFNFKRRIFSLHLILFLTKKLQRVVSFSNYGGEYCFYKGYIGYSFYIFPYRWHLFKICTIFNLLSNIISQNKISVISRINFQCICNQFSITRERVILVFSKHKEIRTKQPVQSIWRW